MKDLIRRLCDQARSLSVQFMDVRIRQNTNTFLQLKFGKVDDAGSGRGLGAGVRVLADDAWGFAATAEVDADSLAASFGCALEMAKASRAKVLDPGVVARVSAIEDDVCEPVGIDPGTVPIEAKIRYLCSQDEAVKKACPEGIDYCSIGWQDRRERMWMGNTFGALLRNEVVYSTVHGYAVAVDGDQRESASEYDSAIGGWELAERTPPEKLGAKAARRALALLKASPPPCGKFPVIFHPDITGLLTHEALGHNAEADLVFGGGSIIEGMLGQKIASPLVTIIDDSTIPGSHGSFRYDHEGVPGRRRVIVENGVLKGYMHSLETASRFGVEPNGSARADRWSSRPIVRMSNTFIERGKTSFEDMVRGMDKGVYLRRGSWGYVQVERGQYNCHAAEAFMIRNGEIAEPLKGVTVNGMTLETLQNIDAVGSDFELNMPGWCGKNGQGAPINAGGPHIRVKELVVGGRGEVASR